MKRIELSSSAWKAEALPLSYTRLKEVWAGMDSNHRRRLPADLQSAAFNHSATDPVLLIDIIENSFLPITTFNIGIGTCLNHNFKHLSHLQDSNPRPTDYKSVALPAELRWQSVLIASSFLKARNINDNFHMCQQKIPFFYFHPLKAGVIICLIK